MRHTQLRSFHAVAATESVTAAANQLHVSQPTLTTQIRSLEEDYAVELFVRTGGRMRLTEAGRRLQEITRRLFANEDEARHFLRESRELRTGHLRVGAVGPFHVTEMLVAFHARYPGIAISVSVGNSRSVLRDLVEFRTDVAILAHVEEDERLLIEEYSRDAIVAFGRHDHPLFAKQRAGIAIGELNGEPMIYREAGSNTRRAAEAAMREAGVEPRIVMEIGSREAVREAVLSGVGIGVVSSAEYVPHDDLVARPFLDAEVFNPARVVCMHDRKHARLIEAFLTITRELATERHSKGLRDFAR